MSNALFHDTVTLYTPLSDGTWQRQTINSVQSSFTESFNEKETVAVVYIPIVGRRALTYLPPHERSEGDPRSFTVNVGQSIVLRECTDAAPPSDALSVKKTVTKRHGSGRMHHIKLIAFNISATEEEV